MKCAVRRHEAWDPRRSRCREAPCLRGLGPSRCPPLLLLPAARADCPRLSDRWRLSLSPVHPHPCRTGSCRVPLVRRSCTDCSGCPRTAAFSDRTAHRSCVSHFDPVAAGTVLQHRGMSWEAGSEHLERVTCFSGGRWFGLEAG